MAGKRKATSSKPGKARKPSKPSSPSSNKVEAEFRQLGKKLRGLIEKTRAAEPQVRAKYAKQISALKAQQAAAKRAVARLKRQSTAASGPLKAGLVKAWRDIDSAVRQATKRFRQTR